VGLSKDTSRLGVDELVCIVTGGSRGIGHEVAKVLRDGGAHVASLDVVPPASSGSGILDIKCNVADPDEIDVAVSKVEESLGAPDVVVNNAAKILVSGTLETSLDQWNEVIGINLTGPFMLARRCAGAMKDRGFGRLINIGSNSGKMGGTLSVAAYAASKAGLHNLSRVWATEFGPFGVTANTVAACLIDTDMSREANMELLAERIPVRRMGTPQDVAWTVAFLADRRSGYINGEVMDLNGGFYLD
jgi:NAD(P)-dependent dehydrogenase (short-subunit alcohol dehydrogenase family)